MANKSSDKSRFRQERIERLLQELRYRIECGMTEGEIDEHLGFAEAIRLLHVVRAWHWTPGNKQDSARVDPLYPARGIGSGRSPLLEAIDKLLADHPYGGAST